MSWVNVGVVFTTSVGGTPLHFNSYSVSGWLMNPPTWSVQETLMLKFPGVTEVNGTAKGAVAVVALTTNALGPAGLEWPAMTAGSAWTFTK